MKKQSWKFDGTEWTSGRKLVRRDPTTKLYCALDSDGCRTRIYGSEVDDRDTLAAAKNDAERAEKWEAEADSHYNP
jgi:hypothetical protein